MPHPPDHDPPPLRLLVLAVLLAVAAVLANLALLRSFEFLPAPGWLPSYVPPPLAAPAAASPSAAPEAVARPPALPALSRGVTLVIADGMRLDLSRALPAWQALRAEGADVLTRALFPTFTRNGTATLLTGVGPRWHGFLSNFNHRQSPVPSIFDLARRAGVHTRLLSQVATVLPKQFPHAFAEIAPLRLEAVASGPRPHLTLVYFKEPDLTAHRHGAASEAYREAARGVDRNLARIRAALDLERETLIVATDHGHLDRGGHGGHEPVIERIPLVLAGAGVRRGAVLGAEVDSDLRDVAPTIAALLGLAPPPLAGGRVLWEALELPATGAAAGLEAATAAAPSPPADSGVRSPERAAVPAGWRTERRPLHPPAPPQQPPFRGAATALALALWPLLLLRPRGLRAAAGAALALGGFYALYVARGHPVSFSCVNAASDIPAFMLEVLGLGLAAALAGVLLAGAARRYAAMALVAAAAVAGGAWGWCGLGAPEALAHPQAAFLAYLALSDLLAVALVSAAAAAWTARRGRRSGLEKGNPMAIAAAGIGGAPAAP
ncbi:MAG: hypothetical protein KatS3mg102_0288 [Planctomycetota bacterium]|nr:MAG: hypothetical protein KatS3mg102_0288 [Planctomycetota bacterium]